MQDVSHIKRLVVVDSTWQQTKQIFRDEKLRGLPCVKLREHKTRFWRYQSKGDDHLATIEGTYTLYLIVIVQQSIIFCRNITKNYLGLMRDKWTICYTIIRILTSNSMQKSSLTESYIYDLIQKHYADNPREFPRIKDYIKKPKAESSSQDKSE